MASDSKITIKQWEDYVVTTALLLGWEEKRFGRTQSGPRWRRAMHWLEQHKHMTVLISGQIIEFIPPTER